MGKKTCVAFFASVIFVFNYFQISPDQAIKQDREDEAGEDEDEQDAPDVMIEVPYEYEDYEIVEKEVSLRSKSNVTGSKNVIWGS